MTYRLVIPQESRTQQAEATGTERGRRGQKDACYGNMTATKLTACVVTACTDQEWEQDRNLIQRIVHVGEWEEEVQNVQRSEGRRPAETSVPEIDGNQ